MPLGELLLASVFKLLLQKLASGELLKLARRERIEDVLSRWSQKLQLIETLLADAEKKQIENEAVSSWLENLNHLAYDLDDVLDGLATEVLRRQLTAADASTSRVRALIPTCCTGYYPTTLWSDYRMKSKIEEIDKSLNDLFEQRTGLGLQSGVAAAAAGSSTAAKAWEREETTSYITEPRVHGREKDKEVVIKFLLGDDDGSSDSSQLGVLPIRGMGGIGKTTLAQMVYDDETVSNRFDHKVWVCVSNDFDNKRVSEQILRSITPNSDKFDSLQQVQDQLTSKLAGKKILLVLDDVWEKRDHDWNVFRSPFVRAAPGSKMVVTTRNKEVALRMGNRDQYLDLQQLSGEDCWAVFAQHAFRSRRIDATPNLESIGRKIVEKCGGSPLAARTLGSLLRHKEKDDEWENVLNSKFWALPQKDNDILPALKLSYYHLPSHLKRCFAYCSIVPMDYEFGKKELVLFWMAEGLIQQSNGDKDMEDVGDEYFDELVSRSLFQPSSNPRSDQSFDELVTTSLFQPSSNPGSSKFVMHDLINDLAQSVGKGICFRLEDKLRDQEWPNNLKGYRHSSYMQSNLEGKKKFEIFYQTERLRTFLPFPKDHSPCHLTNNVTLNLLPALRCLRVLSLRRYMINEVPNSIGDLKHVRYIDLFGTNIETLPESLGSLYNLQTLNLSSCYQLKKLPYMGNLIKLRHLDISDSLSLKEMPEGIGKLKSLRALSNFIVGKDDGIRIRELGNLIHLRGSICISGLENVENPLDARGAKLNEKQRLSDLALTWGESSDGSRNERVEAVVLNMLEPHKKLELLRISGFRGIRFPDWMLNCDFPKMVSIRLSNCSKCTSLPPLGQLPSLKMLYIEGMSAIKHVGPEFYGQGSTKPFPLLETLGFKNMSKWEHWDNFGVDMQVQPFARLINLSILSCPKLLGIGPADLPCLKYLQISQCPRLQGSSPVPPSLASHNMGSGSLQCFPMLLGMRNTLEPTSSTSLDINDVPIPDTLWNPSEVDLLFSANAMSKHLSSLTSLSIVNIRELTFLQRCLTPELTGFEKLEISFCKELTTLWQNEVSLVHQLPLFRHLVIRTCPRLVSIFEEDGGNDGQQQQQHKEVASFVKLQYLQIDNCAKLEKLPQELHSFTSLGELIISNCSSLVSFPKTGFPSTLRKLEIENCDALQSISGWVMQNNSNKLERLAVKRCPSLTYLISSSGGLPSTLKHLEIWLCEKLEALLVDEGMKINCPSLESILIWSCPSLNYLPNTLHHNNLKNLSRLNISKCEKLESLPGGWFPLNSLRQLSIKSCPAGGGIVSYFLETQNFLTNLSELVIWNMKIGKPPSEWGLHRFSSLTSLSLHGPIRMADEEESSSVSSFSVDGMSLPNSLIRLSIMNFANLENLNFVDFHNLNSLEQLRISDCPSLASFPQQGLPSSLLGLYVNGCPKLKSFPKQGLPSSLLQLTIKSCPKLKRWCKKQPITAEIPSVDFEPYFTPIAAEIPSVDFEPYCSCMVAARFYV